MKNETFESHDYDIMVVDAIRELNVGYCACGENKVYRIINLSKSYAVTVPASEPVNKRLFHDIVRAALVCNLLSELFNGEPLKLSVYDALEDIKEEIMLLCEEWIDFFHNRLLTKPERLKCIEIFTLILEALESESRIDILKTF